MKSRDRLVVSVIAVLMGLSVGAVVILLLGKNPLSLYNQLLQGSGLAAKGNYAAGKSMLTDFAGFIDFMTPMVFAALAVAVGLRTGLFNIGVSGQMLIGGFLATVLVGYSPLPAVCAKPLVILIAAASGAAIGVLIGFLKYRFNISEVVSSIMINYIGEYIISFFINTKFIDPISRQSKPISDASRLSLHQVLIGGYRYDLPLTFLLALIAVCLIKLLFDKTVLGYELRAVGSNPVASRYAGINVGKSMVLAMALSGMLGGIAGASYYLGYFASMQPKTLPATGFDAIAVCLVGGSSPVGCLFASFFLEIIEKGATYMSSQSGVESEIASLIMGLILLTSACSGFILSLLTRRRNLKNGGEQHA